MVPLARAAGTPSGAATAWRRLAAIRAGDSPTRLRAAAAVTALCGVLLSIGGWFAVDRREAAIEDAAAAAEQLIRVQDVRVLVVQADSIASGAYLEGGQERPERRADYDARVTAAASGLVQVAASAEGDDIDLLQAATGELARYVGLVEQARANNRQGFPVGAAYQRQAREVAIGLVDDLRTVEQQTRDRVNDSIERADGASWPLVLTAFVLLAAIVVGSLWLAARWRRLVNLPLAAAGVIALLVLTVGVGVNGRAAGDAGDAVSGDLAAADLIAQARAAGFDARADEALTLVARGNGAAYETGWALSSSIVAAALDQACTEFDAGCDAIDAYGRYADGHALIRDLDDGGDWDAAVSLSTTGSAAGVDGAGVDGAGLDPVTDFDDFADRSSTALAARSQAAATTLADAVDPLGALQVIVVVAGLAAAGLAVAGYGQRLREYR